MLLCYGKKFFSFYVIWTSQDISTEQLWRYAASKVLNHFSPSVMLFLGFCGLRKIEYFLLKDLGVILMQTVPPLIGQNPTGAWQDRQIWAPVTGSGCNTRHGKWTMAWVPGGVLIVGKRWWSKEWDWRLGYKKIGLKQNWAPKFIQ